MQSIFLRNNCKKLNGSRCIPGKWWTAIQWCDQQTHWQTIVFTFLPFLFANKPKTYINFFWLSFQLIHPGHCLRNQSPCQGSAMHYLSANHFFFKFFLFLSSYIVPEWENHIEQNQQQETQKKIWVISKLYKYFTVLFISSRNSSVSLPSINGQSGSENLMSSSSSKRPSSDGKRKTTASSKQKINRVSEFLFKSRSHQVIIHCGHHTAHLITGGPNSLREGRV